MIRSKKESNGAPETSQTRTLRNQGDAHVHPDDDRIPLVDAPGLLVGTTDLIPVSAVENLQNIATHAVPFKQGMMSHDKELTEMLQI